MVIGAPVSRGEIWICDVGGDAGTRPVAVISSDALNEVRQKIVVVIGTRNRRNLPTEIGIGKSEGLRHDGVLSAADIMTVDRGLLLRRSGRLTEEKIQCLEDAVRVVLGI